jgi:hypothetical protein
MTRRGQTPPSQTPRSSAIPTRRKPDHAIRYLREHRQIPRLMIGAVVMTAGLLALVLFLRDRKQYLYLWLGLYLISDGISTINNLDGIRYGMSFFTNHR